MNFSPGVVLANSGSAIIELPIALYNHLSSIISYPVFDGAPQDQAMPFVDLGESVITEYDADGRDGFSVLITVHAWSAKLGRYECKQMLDAIYRALHRAELSVAGYNCTGVDYVTSRVMKDSDGVTSHGVIQFRILLFKTEG
jgi:hypothetical protein